MTFGVFDSCAVHLDPVQLAAEADGIFPDDVIAVHTAALRGLSGASTALPHAEAIQRSFGPDNDVSGIRAHVGGPATEATAAMGATAYATGDSVAFASAPDLHTAAHEAAHVFQQQAGVQLHGGVGQVGDPYERHADAVADLVVAGQPAADLLAAGPGGGGTSAVQRKGAKEAELGDIAGGLLNVSPGVARIAEATADLEIAKAKAERVLAQWQSGKLEAHIAAREVVHILGATIEPIGVLKAAVAHQAAMPNAIRQRDHEGREESQALGSNRPVIFDALNNVTRVVLEIARATADAPGATGRAASSSPAALVTHLANVSEVDAMNRMLDTVAAIARPIGWSPPANLEQANVVRFAFEACPPGSDVERPEDCALGDARRVEARGDFYRACTAAHGEFKRATEKVKEPLESMIKEEQKARSLVVDIAIGALDKALGAAIPGMPAVGDLVLGQAKDQLKSAMEDASHAEPIPGQGTVSMLDALLEAIKEALATVQTTAKHLDDQAILAATKKVQQLDVPYFVARLTSLVVAFGQQIDPIGRPRTISDELGLSGPSGTWDAVRVRLPAGELRAAQVVRGSQPGKKPGQYRPVYNFVRWIDAQFGPMVEGAPIIDYTGINSLPLGEVLAP
ncbi:MAG: DUF4157 domain-containing protein [Kofleriaceae bacterium]|nr:DUF4157 domain-containing protein [Kofleriaceae bacterium]MBP9172888.1 DUF4157 domain-containing protein [Kofleriaceae bacterium]MBP9863543.1 DUF4157 domain-containing protein [Kofleriaceae bacterium]